MVRPLPKRWLIHSIIYEGFTDEKDDFQKPVYDDPVTIDYVRVDDETVFSRDSTDTKILANAIIYVDAKHSTNLPEEFKEESIITFNSKPYVLQKVIETYHPTKNKVHHWELEVI